MNFIKAFSIAEVAIALVIGSIILGMSAPMVTKQIKNQSLTDTQLQVLQTQINQLRATKTNIPSGAIMFFEGNCPDDSWTDMSSAYAGRYVRIAGSYNICDKKGENADGSCVSIKSTSTLSAGLKQGEANRRIIGTLPGIDADIGAYSSNDYVARLKMYGFLSGIFDFVKSSELTDNNSPFKFPSNWNSLHWLDTTAYAKMYNTKNTYLQYTDPGILSDIPSTGSPNWFLNSIDSKRVLPTDTTNDETRPKTIVLKACKAP